MDVIGADVVILTALDEEHVAVMRALDSGAIRPWRGRRLGVGKVGPWDVVVSPTGGMGNVSSAHAATLAVSVWNPTYLFLVGIAGGIREAGGDLRLGDVLVPDRIVGYEQAKVRPDGIDRQYEVAQPDWELLEVARGLESGEWAHRVARSRPDGQGGRTIPRVFFGPMFSGAKVITDEAMLRALRVGWRKAIGVEMESLGVAVASYRGGPGFLVVKAVSDFADPDKNDDWHGYAAECAAYFAVAVLRHAPARPMPRRRQATPVAAPQPFPGRAKVHFCRMLHTSWAELADAFEVPPHERARFQHGDQARDLWEWLEVRGKLPVVADVLDELGREDLAALMRTFKA